MRRPGAEEVTEAIAIVMTVLENVRRPDAENYENETVLILLLRCYAVEDNEDFNRSAQG